jgi:predicted transcriptional regulator
MEAVWTQGEVTVRDVHARLRQIRPIAYTTVMTTMGRLSEKGFLRRIENQPAHRYHPLVSREQYARSTAHSVIDWLLSRFRDPALAYFIDRVEESDVDAIETLRKAIQERESQQPGD